MNVIGFFGMALLMVGGFYAFVWAGISLVSSGLTSVFPGMAKFNSLVFSSWRLWTWALFIGFVMLFVSKGGV